MKKVLLLVDSINYIANNCFQHQLNKVFSRHPNCKIEMVSHMNIKGGVHKPKDYDVVVSLLKQRTLFNNLDSYVEFLGDKSITIYDQDPWEAFRIGSPYIGAYKKFYEKLNVKKFAVTTKWWADYISKEHGYPTDFVKMWVLPEYCNDVGKFDSRPVQLGFIGQSHSYRKQLFDQLAKMNHPVENVQGSTNYQEFLNALRKIKIYIHSEDIPIKLERGEANIGTGLWVKDVEAASQGCFSIRNRLEGFESYFGFQKPKSSIETVYLYDDVKQIPDLIEEILILDEEFQQNLIDETVNFIKNYNAWDETVMKLIT